MQAILDFLLDYYLYVLGLFGAILLTLIGFLADTRKRKKMREKKMKEKEVKENSVKEDENVNFNSLSQGINMDYDFGQESLNDSFANNVGVVPDMSMANNPMNNAQFNVQMDDKSMSGSSEPTLNPSGNDSFFVPASNQTPSFEPLNIPVQAPVNMNNQAPVQEVKPPVNMNLNQGMINNNVPPITPNNINYPGMNMAPNNNMMANQFQAPPIQVTSIPEMVQQSSMNMPPLNGVPNNNVFPQNPSMEANYPGMNMAPNNNMMPGPMPAMPNNNGPVPIMPTPTGNAMPNPIPNVGPSINMENSSAAQVNNMVPNQGTYPMNNMPSFVSGQNNNNN